MSNISLKYELIEDRRSNDLRNGTEINHFNSKAQKRLQVCQLIYLKMKIQKLG